MIPISYYTAVYYIFTSSITLILCVRLFTEKNTNLENEFKNKAWSTLLLLVTILFIGLREPWDFNQYFGDTVRYTRRFEQLAMSASTDLSGARDVMFLYFMQFSASFMNVSMFYFLCAFLYVYPVYATFKKWFSSFAVYALFIYVASFSFWGYGINGIRSGLAASFFIFAIGNVNRKWLMLLFMALSASMHLSILMPIAIFFISFVVKNAKWVIIIWFASIAVCLLAGYTILNLVYLFMPGIVDEGRAATYLMMGELRDEVLDNIRFRPDFILYSAIPILLGWYYMKKGYKDRFYTHLFNTYVLTNAVWIALFMYAPYTNRFAFLSWCIMPIVMIYPLLKKKIMKNQYRFIGYLIFGNLLFTLFMFIR